MNAGYEIQGPNTSAVEIFGKAGPLIIECVNLPATNRVSFFAYSGKSYIYGIEPVAVFKVKPRTNV